MCTYFVPHRRLYRSKSTQLILMSTLLLLCQMAIEQNVTANTDYCRDLTRRLRDTCLDDECDVCDEMIEEESSSSSSDDDNVMAGLDEDLIGPCRAKCSGQFKPLLEPGAGMMTVILRVLHVRLHQVTCACLDSQWRGLRMQPIFRKMSASFFSMQNNDDINYNPYRTQCARAKVLSASNNLCCF